MIKMPNFPFFNMPYFQSYKNYYNRYNYYQNNIRNPKSTTSQTTSSTKKNDNTDLDNIHLIDKPKHDTKQTPENRKSFKDNSQALFSIFGLDLYSDDILILCLLFFLYVEGVKDEMLFLCLILLLIS